MWGSVHIEIKVKEKKHCYFLDFFQILMKPYIYHVYMIMSSKPCKIGFTWDLPGNKLTSIEYIKYFVRTVMIKEVPNLSAQNKIPFF